MVELWEWARLSIKELFKNEKDIMSIAEAEEMLEITEEDKVECPYGDCEDCPYGLDATACEELYEEWLLEQLTLKNKSEPVNNDDNASGRE